MRPVFLLALAGLLAGSTATLAAQESAPPAAKADKQDQAKKKPKRLEIGAEVPADLQLHDLEGKPFKFGDHRGKTVVVHFWSIICPWEELAEPKLQKIASDYADKDVVVVAINGNAGEIGKKPAPEAFQAEKSSERPYLQIREHNEKVKLNHKALVDHSGDVVRFFDAKTTPHCFVIDAKGVLRYSGALDNDGRGNKGDEAVHYVRDAIDAVRAGEEVATPTTRPYG